MNRKDFTDKPTIVIVDDDRELLELLTRLFAEDGHEVQTRTSGSGLIEDLEEHGGDVLILAIWPPCLC